MKILNSALLTCLSVASLNFAGKQEEEGLFCATPMDFNCEEFYEIASMHNLMWYKNKMQECLLTRTPFSCQFRVHQEYTVVQDHNWRMNKTCDKKGFVKFFRNYIITKFLLSR